MTTGKAVSITGVLATAYGILDSQQVLSLLGPKAAAIIGAVGAVLAIFGVTLHTDTVAAR